MKLRPVSSLLSTFALLLPVLVLVLALVLSGCNGGQKPYQLTAPFEESPFIAYAQPGTGVIEGQAFVKLPDGKVVYAAGNEVGLLPVTDYTREWFEAGVLPNRPVTPFDPRIGKYFRHTRADAEGRFAFPDLPEGQYYVAVDIPWTDALGKQYIATAYADVTLPAGKQLHVIVTRP